MNEVEEKGLMINYDKRTLSIVDLDNGDMETYSLTTIPARESSLVQDLEKNITQELQIKSIVTNMNNAAGLMFVAYNALSGTLIQSKMSGLQKNLLDLCDRSLVSITDFRANSEKVANYIIKAYDYLIKNKETTALKQFKRCSTCAKKMAEAAEELAEGFIEISDKTEQVLESTQDEQALQYQNMKKLEQQLIEYNTKLKENKKILEEQLNIEINEANSRYEEAKKKEAKDEKRKRAFEIVQLVGTVVSGIVDTFTPNIGALTNKDNNSDSSSEKLKEQLADANSKLEDCNNELAQKTDKQNELNSKKQELENKISDLNSQLADAKKDQALGKDVASTIDLLSGSINSAQGDLLACTSEIGLVIKAVEACNYKIESVKKQIESINAQCSKISESAQRDLDKSSAEKASALEKKLELEKQRRDMLENMAEWTATIESSSKAKDTASTAVETLHVAIKCLKEIVTSLQTASLFWRSMERFCESLSESEVVEIIEDTAEDDEEEKKEYYMGTEFMGVMLRYLAQWAALYYVCDDYLKETRAVRGEVVENIKQAPSIEEGLSMAPDLAMKMGVSIQKQINESNEVIKAIEGGITVA